MCPKPGLHYVAFTSILHFTITLKQQIFKYCTVLDHIKQIELIINQSQT